MEDILERFKSWEVNKIQLKPNILSSVKDEVKETLDV